MSANVNAIWSCRKNTKKISDDKFVYHNVCKMVEIWSIKKNDLIVQSRLQSLAKI